MFITTRYTRQAIFLAPKGVARWTTSIQVVRASPGNARALIRQTTVDDDGLKTESQWLKPGQKIDVEGGKFLLIGRVDEQWRVGLDLSQDISIRRDETYFSKREAMILLASRSDACHIEARNYGVMT